MSHRLVEARLHHAAGCNVLLLSYRGYGASQGSPSQAGFVNDARAAIAYLADRAQDIDVSKVFLFGRSIGGACAIHVAAQHQHQQEEGRRQRSVNGQRDGSTRLCIKGIIVENTFTSIDDMIDVVFPVLSFAKPLNRNKWNSLRAIQKIRAPILFLRYVYRKIDV